MLALVTVGRKLRPYFQVYTITVVSSFLLRAILHKPDIFSQLTKWAVELSEYDLSYVPRTAIKSQVLTDFIVDFSTNDIQAKKELLSVSKDLKEQQ